MRRNLPFSVVTKPTGAACNLDCTYCFFLSKELLHDADGQRMSEATLRTYIANQLESQPTVMSCSCGRAGNPPCVAWRSTRRQCATHASGTIEKMARLLQAGRAPAEVMFLGS